MRDASPPRKATNTAAVRVIVCVHVRIPGDLFRVIGELLFALLCQSNEVVCQRCDRRVASDRIGRFRDNALAKLHQADFEVIQPRLFRRLTHGFCTDRFCRVLNDLAAAHLGCFGMCRRRQQARDNYYRNQRAHWLLLYGQQAWPFPIGLENWLWVVNNRAISNPVLSASMEVEGKEDC